MGVSSASRNWDSLTNLVRYMTDALTSASSALIFIRGSITLSLLSKNNPTNFTRRQVSNGLLHWHDQLLLLSQLIDQVSL